MKIKKLLALCILFFSLTVFAKQSDINKNFQRAGIKRSLAYQSSVSQTYQDTTNDDRHDKQESESDNADSYHNTVLSDTGIDATIHFKEDVSFESNNLIVVNNSLDNDKVTLTPTSSSATINVIGETNISSEEGVLVTELSGNNEICANVYIDHHDLLVASDVTIKGSLFVQSGSVRISTGATLTVNGHIIFDGGSKTGLILSKSVDIAGSLIVNGSGQSVIRNYALTVANSFGSTSAVYVRSTGTLHTAGPLTVVNNSSTVGDAVRIESNQSLTSDNQVLLAYNFSVFSGGHGVNVIGTLASRSSDVDLQDNVGTDAGSGVRVEGTVRAHRNVVLNRNARAGSGVGHGVSVVSGGLVEAHHDISIKNNTPGTDQINVAGRLDANRNITFDQPVDVAAVFGKTGTVHGYVIVNGDLFVDESLTIEGSLTVFGSVTINSGTVLMVFDDIIFDGQQRDKSVSLVGTGSIVAKNVIIQNYKSTLPGYVAVSLAAGSSIVVHKNIEILNNSGPDGDINVPGTEAVEIAGFIASKGSIIITNNIGGKGGVALGVGLAGAHAVFVMDTLTASDIVFQANKGGAGSAAASGDGGAGGAGVIIANDINAYANMVLIDNDGGNGGNAVTAGVGGAGGHGVIIGSGITVTVDSDVTVRNNDGGTGGNTVSGTNGSGGHGLNIEGTVKANARMLLGDNSGGAVGTGGAGGTAGVDLNIAGTGVLQTPDNTIVFDQDVTVSTEFVNAGTINGRVIIYGNLLVDADLTIVGDLTVKGSVTINADITLDVSGDILFDGQRQALSVEIAGNIIVGNLTIKNYQQTFGSTVAVMIQNNGNNNVAVIATGDIILKDNYGFSREGVLINESGSGSVMIAANSGKILFKGNKSNAGNGREAVCIGPDITTFTAHHIIFADNESLSTNTDGVAIYSDMIAFDTMRFDRNKTAATNRYGVQLNSTTQTATNLFFIHKTAANNGGDTNLEIDDSSATLTQDFYGIATTLYKNDNASF